MLKDKKLALYELAKREARQNFWSFCLFLNYDLFKQKENYIKDIANTLNKAYYANSHSKISISTPPRAMKSTITNHFIAWCLGKDVNNSIIRASYSFDLSSELNEQCRQLIDSIKYKELFSLEIIQNNQKELRLKGAHRVNLYASSVGGSTTGFGANIIIADDIYKDHTEALSDTINKKTINWYQSAFQSRLDGNKTIEILIGTRWRIGELYDELNNNNYFTDKIKVRALNNNNKSFNETVISTTRLLELKKIMHASIFNSMYQQEPMFAKGGLIDASNLKYIEEVESVKYRYALIDSKTTGKDYFAMAIIAITNNDLILEDVIYSNEVVSEALEQKVIRVLNHYQPVKCWIEINNDYSFYRNIKKYYQNAKGYRTKDNKETKILVNGKKIENITFRITEDKEYNQFINNILSYDLENKNQHDDAIDCLVMLIQKLEQVKIMSF